MNTSVSSRLRVENSETIAPSSPARNQCSVSGGIVNCSPGPEVDLAVALDPEHDAAGAAAERLLLAGLAVDRRMPVLRARLAREEDELLRAHALRVHVDDDLQADLARGRPSPKSATSIAARSAGVRTMPASASIAAARSRASSSVTA